MTRTVRLVKAGVSMACPSICAGDRSGLLSITPLTRCRSRFNGERERVLRTPLKVRPRCAPGATGVARGIPFCLATEGASERKQERGTCCDLDTG